MNTRVKAGIVTLALMGIESAISAGSATIYNLKHVNENEKLNVGEVTGISLAIFSSILLLSQACCRFGIFARNSDESQHLLARVETENNMNLNNG